MKYLTFAHWVQQMRRRAELTGVGEKIQFAEVRLSDGTIVRGDDVLKLAALVRALRN